MSGWRRLVPRAVREGLDRWTWERRALAWTLESGLHARVRNLGDWVVYNEIFVDGLYDEAIRAALDDAAGTRVATVLDLGANVGFFALRIAEEIRRTWTEPRRAELILVEGHPGTFRELERRMRAQPLDARTKVRLVHGLAGARSGEAAIAAGSFHPAARVVGDQPGGVRVGFVDLGKLVPDATPIDLVKCDIEGSESSVLETYPDLWRRTRVVVVEFHLDDAKVEACAALLSAAGLARRTTLRRSPDARVELFRR